MKKYWENECLDSSLLEEEFLIALFEQETRETYARIASLDINELPIDYIEGKVSGGSINVDGDSSVRRSCSLTMVTDEIDINDYYWGLKTKFKLEIGLKNNMRGVYAAHNENPLRPQIVWFKGGTYLISSFNTSISTNNCSISLQGKDKMCMLNGDFGGSLFASIDFGTEEYQEKILVKANTDYTDSDSLMRREYYYEYNDGPEIVYQNNNLYCFLQDSQGEYWKNGNQYVKGEGKIPKYKIYKLITSPEELFTNVEITEVININQNTNEKEINPNYKKKKVFLEKTPSANIYQNYFSLQTTADEIQATYQENFNCINNLITEYQITGNTSEDQIADAKEKLAAKKAEIIDQLQLIENTQKQIESISRKIAYTKEILPQAKSFLKEYQSELEKLNNKLSRLTNQEEINQCLDQIAVCQVNINEQTQYIQELENQLLNLKNELQTLKNNLTEYNEQLEILKQDEIKLSSVEIFQTVQVLKDLYQVDYTYEIRKIPLEKIIREGVHAYALEPYYNIIINDLDEYGLEQLSYRGEDTLYAIRQVSTGHFVQLLFAEKNPSLKALIEAPSGFELDTLVVEFTNDNNATKIKKNGQTWVLAEPGDEDIYTVAAINYGDDLGYRITDLTYTGDLISSIGESFTSILDKIKNMLGDFEYFYDLDGRFVFQRKKIYVNTAWSTITKTNGENWVDYANSTSKFSYNFEGNRLFTSINNTPVLNNVKNDYIVWGKRKGISGADIPIHARYAIDKKPVRYEAFDGRIYVTAAAGAVDRLSAIGNETPIIMEVDWRELIYQMAEDYFAGQGCSEKQPIYNLFGTLVLDEPDLFLYEVGRRNPYYYPSGMTGYEQYYTDMEGFWRQLYDPFYFPRAIFTPGEYTSEVVKDDTSNFYYKTQNWQDTTITDYQIDYYFSANKDSEEHNQYPKSLEAINKFDKYRIWEGHNDDEESLKRLYWNVNVFEAPETLNFWIEFLDSNSELAQFSIPVIGDRTKVVNDDKASAIVFREIPDLVLVDRNADIERLEEQKDLRQIIQAKTGYSFIYLPKGFSQYLTISYRSTSVKNKIDQLLYQFGYCIENISLNALPIYTLQPNTRIYVYDKTTKINGEYIVSKLTIPLNFNGTMSITATKAPERLY